MIKASGDMKDGRRIVFLGLSDKNWEELRKNRPIVVDLAELGVEGVVVLMGGETEETLKEELAKHVSLPE